MSAALEVWLDSDLPAATMQAGTLTQDCGTLRFAYSPAWLSCPHAFAIDPALTLDKGDFFCPATSEGTFGVFDDSSPDRWGKTLMKRREALEAQDQGRVPRVLTAWDYLMGVQDVTRQGALRLRTVGTEPFLANAPLPAPPFARLRELEAVARELSARRIDDLDALRRWLSVLVAPGASLGGARPKANFTGTDGSLWIAKFPSREDDRDVGAWEFVAHTLAAQAGIDVPGAQLLRFGKDFHTYCAERFDRVGGKRRFYASALSLLRRNESEGASYLEIAEFIQRNGAARHIARDLAQLFRRVVFNVATGNRDDHLRNHGFLLTPDGWRLAPAFDVNPNIEKAEHVLNLDDTNNSPSLAAVIATAEWYGLSKDQGRVVVDEVIAVTRQWREAASQAQVSRADIEMTAVAFECTTRAGAAM